MNAKSESREIHAEIQIQNIPQHLLPLPIHAHMDSSNHFLAYAGKKRDLTTVDVKQAVTGIGFTIIMIQVPMEIFWL